MKQGQVPQLCLLWLDQCCYDVCHCNFSTQGRMTTRQADHTPKKKQTFCNKLFDGLHNFFSLDSSLTGSRMAIDAETAGEVMPFVAGGNYMQTTMSVMSI